MSVPGRKRPWFSAERDDAERGELDGGRTAGRGAVIVAEELSSAATRCDIAAPQELQKRLWA